MIVTENRQKKIKQLADTIAKLSVGGQTQFAQCFEVFLDLHLNSLCNNPSEQQIKLCEYLKDETFNADFVKAMELYGECAEGYYDPLGDMFQEYVSGGQHGQFFTPDAICEIMSGIALDSDDVKDKKSIYDPTCGSGRLLLAGLSKAREKGYEPLIYGNDLSMTCCKMTLLNLLIQTAGGMVTCGNTLLDPRDMFFYIDRVKFLPIGKVFATYWQYTEDTAKEVAKKREDWLLKLIGMGYIPYNGNKALKMTGNSLSEGNTAEVLERAKEIHTPDPLPTQIKQNEKGQLTLF